MKIIVDENMSYAREAFSTLGEVSVLPGRKMTRENIADAEILCVRSVTKVNEALLRGSTVRYVATATIGFDHIDTQYLDSAGIKYCNAPGCNADAVADYVTAALLLAAKTNNIHLNGRTLGVIGCGNVGSRVVKRAKALGMHVLENDPPLARKTGASRYVPLEELYDADIITLHVPLKREGDDPTFRMINEKFLERLRSGMIYINTARGGITDEAALKIACNSGKISRAILDVWENEPNVDPEMIQLTAIATPHIAGYSFEGKINGSVMVYEQVCRWLGVEPTWNGDDFLPEPNVPLIEIDAAETNDLDVLQRAVATVYPIEQDGKAMRPLANMAYEKRAYSFDALRRNYPTRREFSATTIKLKNASRELADRLRGLTFEVDEI